jgi:transposase-like protein
MPVGSDRGVYRRLITTEGTAVGGEVEVVYPQVARQRCWFHKRHNVAGVVRTAVDPLCYAAYG